MIVVNHKRDSANGVGEYIGRPSVLGNPFRIGPDGPRERVIALYKEWLWDKIVSGDPDVIKELYRLHNQHERTGYLSLVCWCAPKPCHGDVIRAALCWMKTKDFAKRGIDPLCTHDCGFEPSYFDSKHYCYDCGMEKEEAER